MNDKKAVTANMALLCAAMLWGGGFVASKVALSGWPPFVLLALRFGLAVLLLGLLFHKRIFKTPRKTMGKGFVLGELIFLAFSLQLMGLRQTTSTKAAFLCTSYVVLVPLISWAVFRRRPGLRALVAGVLAFTGIGAISLNEGLSLTAGDALCLLYNLPYGLALVLIGAFSGGDTDTIQMTFFQFLTISLSAFALCLLTSADFQCHASAAVPGLVYLSIACTLVAMLLQNTAQRHTAPAIASLLISLESVFGFLFSLLYFQERVTLRVLAGCALCFAAILISNWNRPFFRRPKAASASEGRSLFSHKFKMRG